MKKILFFATYPNQPIGYAKVGCILANYLVGSGYDVHYLGITNYPVLNDDRYIDPRIKMIDALEESKKINSSELYGVDIIRDILDRVKPDILFIYNDLIVVNRLFLQLKDYEPMMTKPKAFKTYVYIDLVYPYERLDYIEHMDNYCDKIFVFSECWKQNLKNILGPKDNISILPHGFSQQFIRKMNKEVARKNIGVSNDAFIIFNNNRNSYRKALDITIASFLRFYKNNNYNNRIKLFLNCRLKMEDGYDVLHLILTECVKLNVPYEEVVNSAVLCYGNNSGLLTDEKVNEIYNASDLGINTCIGEGFGLCNLEHGGLDIPQVVTCTGALEDIFKPIQDKIDAPILIKPVTEMYISNLEDKHGGYVSITNPDDFAKAFQYYYDNPDKCISEGSKIGKHIRETYNWDIILKNFVEEL